MVSICVEVGVTVPAVGSNEISLPSPSTAVQMFPAGHATELSACDPSIDTLAGARVAPGGNVISWPGASAAVQLPPGTQVTALSLDPSMVPLVALFSGSLLGLNRTSLPVASTATQAVP